jgi:hypothetical protein
MNVLQEQYRLFESGATRDVSTNKPEYVGYLSPAVLVRFGQYMMKHQTMPDGSKRDCNNWQKGIPVPAYMDSLLRHIIDVWLHYEGRGDLSREEYQEALCACLFNVQGLLFEDLRRTDAPL